MSNISTAVIIGGVIAATMAAGATVVRRRHQLKEKRGIVRNILIEHDVSQHLHTLAMYDVEVATAFDDAVATAFRLGDVELTRTIARHAAVAVAAFATIAQLTPDSQPTTEMVVPEEGPETTISLAMRRAQRQQKMQSHGTM